MHPDIRVARSPIQGLGLFAAASLPAGTVAVRIGGEVIDDARLAALDETAEPYSSICVAEGTHLLLDPAHPVRYGNHSCDPNLWHTGATTLVLRRDVPAAAELTVDYATHTGMPGFTMPCSCGAAACRRVVSGEDWRRPDLRAAYGDHWSPPLLARIRHE